MLAEIYILKLEAAKRAKQEADDLHDIRYVRLTASIGPGNVAAPAQLNAAAPLDEAPEQTTGAI
jgi:hypothetical protein